MKILAVDHGSKRLGVAISDETETLARPLALVEHKTLILDAATVAEIASREGAGAIIVGQSTGEDGELTLAGRRAANFARVLATQTGILIKMWDEAFTTRDAQSARLESGASRKARSGHLDQVAAAILLQSYLDGRKEFPTDGK